MEWILFDRHKSPKANAGTALPIEYSFRTVTSTMMYMMAKMTWPLRMLLPSSVRNFRPEKM